MGIDIASFVEVRESGVWRLVFGQSDDWHPFDWRDYGLYGFLADVRNYSHVPVIAEPRGVPEDCSTDARAWYDDGFGASWLTLAELQAFDYDQVFWDRRIERRQPSGVIDGAALAEEGEGEHLTVRAFLGSGYFADLGRIERACPNTSPEDIRVVFWFD